MPHEVWARAGLPTDLLTALLARWSEPHRRYHTPHHLDHVLRAVDTLAHHATTPDLVRLAACYHDAVYQGRPDDEEASARLAEADLTPHLPAPDVAEVTRLIRLTNGHHVAQDDPNGAVLCDADLRILSSPPSTYTEYTHAVRAEYAYVPDDQFRVGRARVLESLLALPSLYRTPEARADWEPRARHNLTTELAALSA
ncbi:HD domain-containing protein [Actinokineospora bangkokensis]|uniref:Metal-dependent phosphohydrolase n=1 Tax=Actinokineospora bangkokensis TaxID=1193682 RepID=A0A1Q9LD79_9PSEU|nr:metal-dependent phosphohydrolase [Actinokineospora bangkokensis]OLR89990.1 metal-dependent phosphohydrolase [Actinokineospora bangkokensis]